MLFSGRNFYEYAGPLGFSWLHWLVECCNLLEGGFGFDGRLCFVCCFVTRLLADL